MKKKKLSNISKPIKINQKKFFDKRGYFQELYLKKNLNLNIKFTAIARSKKNVIRGLHFQIKNKQTKLIYVAHGKILDVVVNLKKSSKNFGKLYRFILNEGEMLFIPDHYAHGYECLSKRSTVFYHLEKYRDVKNEFGIRFNDKKLKIKWSTKKPILSLRDQTHLGFDEFKRTHKTL